MPKKILCICDLGRNRSRYLASYLKKKGYLTRFGGIKIAKNELSKINENGYYPKQLLQNDIKWCDVIILVRRGLRKTLVNKFKPEKKIILLQVSDNQSYVGRKYPAIKKLSYREFQKKWVEPQLEKAIQRYFPL